MNKEDLKSRDEKIRRGDNSLCNSLPKSNSNDVVSYQILKSATSVAANYRASLRGKVRLPNLFLNLIWCLEEADESMFWFEIIEEEQIINLIQIN